MTRVAARAILAKLAPDQRARLRELWFLYELRDAEGRESSPDHVLARVEAELGDPVVLDAVKVRAAVERARQIHVALANAKGYDEVKQVLVPVMELVPPVEELERQILAFPADIALAWLVEKYFANRHFDPSYMQAHLFTLITSLFGRRALAVVEHRIGEGTPISVTWRDATEAGLRILGPKFRRWYQRVRGTSYDDDRARHLAEEERRRQYLDGP